MKTMNLLKLAVVSVLAAVILGACGADNDNIPKAYQGTFQGQNGEMLILSGSKAQLSIEGKTLSANVAPLSYKTLLVGQPGFYIYQENKDDKVLDVYWITPNVATKKEEGGIVYYTTDIVYTQIDLNQKNAVQSVTIVHSDVGTVMLDSQSKEWQAGWPEHSETSNLVRVAAQK